MKIISFFLFFFICSFFIVKNAYSQIDRFKIIEEKLVELEKISPELRNKIDFSVSGVSLQEFLRALAETNNLNFNISADLNSKVYNSFNQEKVSNILLFVIKEYDLDINLYGSIISFYKFNPVPIEKKVKPKELIVNYNPYSNTLSFDLKDDTLSIVIKRIAKLTKKNIIISPNIMDSKVSLYLNETNFEDAIEKLAYIANLRLERIKDNSYILLKNDDKDNYSFISASPNKRKQNKKVNGINLLEVKLDSTGKELFEIQIENVSLQEVLRGIADVSNLNYILYSELKGNITISAKEIQIDDLLKQIFNGTDYTFLKNRYNIYLIGDRRFEGLRQNKNIQLRNRSIDNIIETLPTDLKRGVEIKEFKELNSLLLTGSMPQINEIEEFITKLDVVVPMITIEVILMEIRKGKSINTGLKMGIGDSVRTAGSIFGGVDITANSATINDFLTNIGKNSTINIGKVSPSFYATLTALEENNNVDIRSMPKLTTLNGHEASLVIGSTRYYSITTQNVIGSLNPQTVVTQQFNPVSANLEINIVPIVSGDEQVTLKIDVKISDFIGTPPNNAPPPSSNSQFKSLVRAQNDEMIVLGGLERTEKSESGSGFPILSRIPVLKWIFSSRSKANSKVVSVVFLRPRISF